MFYRKFHTRFVCKIKFFRREFFIGKLCIQLNSKSNKQQISIYLLYESYKMTNYSKV